MKNVIKGRNRLFDYIRCVRLFELADDLNVKHQVSSVDVLHHIIQTVLQKQHMEAHTHTHRLSKPNFWFKLKSQPFKIPPPL